MKMQLKATSAPTWLLLCGSCSLLLLQFYLQLVSGADSLDRKIVKRQASGGRQGAAKLQVSSSLSDGDSRGSQTMVAAAMSMSDGASPAGDSGASGAGPEATGAAKRRPLVDSVRQPRPNDYEPAPNENQESPPPPQRRPPARPEKNYGRRPNHRHRDEDEDCEDGEEYADYGDMFQMAAIPMRQFNRMMNSVLSRMPIGAGSDYDERDLPPGASMASASAFRGGDGYSRIASSVNNNGRTRGIISETRNGRTQTRMIGDNEESRNLSNDYD